MAERADFDQVDRRLRSVLDNLHSVLLGVEDLADISARELSHAVEERTGELTDLLEELDALCTASESSAVQLRAVLGQAVDRAFAACAHPVVTRTTLPPPECIVVGPRDPIRVLLCRALSLAFRFAGPGGQVAIRTGAAADAVELTISVRPAGELPPAVLERTASLCDFAPGVGCEAAVRCAGGEIELRLGFALALRD